MTEKPKVNFSWWPFWMAGYMFTTGCTGGVSGGIERGLAWYEAWAETIISLLFWPLILGDFLGGV